MPPEASLQPHSPEVSGVYASSQKLPCSPPSQGFQELSRRPFCSSSSSSSSSWEDDRQKCFRAQNFLDSPSSTQECFRNLRMPPEAAMQLRPRRFQEFSRVACLCARLWQAMPLSGWMARMAIFLSHAGRHVNSERGDTPGIDLVEYPDQDTWMQLADCRLEERRHCDGEEKTSQF